MDIKRYELGGGSILVDEKYKTVTFEEAVDIKSEPLTVNQLYDDLKLNVIFGKRIYCMSTNRAIIDPESNLGLEIRDGWVLHSADYLQNCTVIGYYNFTIIGSSKVTRPIYVDGMRVEMDKFNRVFLSDGYNMLVYLNANQAEKDGRKITFSAVTPDNIISFKTDPCKNVMIHIPVNF